MTVQQFYNKNQFVITCGREVAFQSYDSTIATIDAAGRLRLGDNWDYSYTTLKHLYLFLEDYKNILDNFIYSQIFSTSFSARRNKKAFLKNLLDKKIIKSI